MPSLFRLFFGHFDAWSGEVRMKTCQWSKFSGRFH